MKVFLAVLVALVAVNAHSKKQCEKVVEVIKFCAEKTGLDYEVAKKLKHAIVESNEINEGYFKCFFQKFEFINEAGELKPELIFTTISEGKSEEKKLKVKQLIEKCTTATAGETITALKVHNCYVEGREKEISKKIDETTKLCADKTGLEYDVAKKFRRTVIESTEAHEAFYKCYFIESGFMDEAGVIKPDVILEKLTDGKSDEKKEKYKIIIDKCTTAAEGEKLTALTVHNCKAEALNQAKEKKIDEYVKFCAEKTGIELEAARKLKHAVVESTEVYENYFKCFFVKAEFMTEDAVIKPDVMFEKISERTPEDKKDELKELIKKCTTKTDGETLTALKIHNCYALNHEHKPHRKSQKI